MKTLLKKQLKRARNLAAATRAAVFRTDKSRWKKVSNEVPSWDARNRLVAQFIPGNSSVADLGAGAGLLRNYLKPGCEYQPCDCVDTLPGVIHCDFNSEIYPTFTRKYDYIVCSGVLEYVRAPEVFFARLHGYGSKIILTYNFFTGRHSVVERMALGWVNHLTEADFQKLISASHLECRLLGEHSEWEKIFELAPMHVAAEANHRARVTA